MQLSFKFKPEAPVFRKVNSFTYKYRNNKAWVFAYSRIKELNKTTLFNDPVAMLKVATGLIDIYEMFVERVPYDTVLNKTEEIHREAYEMNNPWCTPEYNVYRDTYSMVQTCYGEFTHRVLKMERKNFGEFAHRVLKMNRENFFIDISHENPTWSHSDFFARIDKYVYIDKKPFLWHDTVYDSGLNKTMLAYMSNPTVNWMWNGLSYRPFPETNFYENIHARILAKESIATNSIENIHGRILAKESITTNWIDGFMTTKPDNITNWIDGFMVTPQNISVNWLWNGNAELKFPNVRYFKNIYARIPEKESIRTEFINGVNAWNYSSKYRDVISGKNILGYKEWYGANSNKVISLEKQYEQTDTRYEKLFLSQGDKHAGYQNILDTKKVIKDAQTQYTGVLAGSADLLADLNYNDYFLGLQDRPVMCFVGGICQEWLNINDKNGKWLTSNIPLKAKGRFGNMPQAELFLGMHPRNMERINNIFRFDKQWLNLSLMDYMNKWLYKEKYDFVRNNLLVDMWKTRKGMWIKEPEIRQYKRKFPGTDLSSGQFLYKNRFKMDLFCSGTFIYKELLDMDNFCSFVPLNKDKHDLSDKDYSDFMFKDLSGGLSYIHNLTKLLSEVWLTKEPHDLFQDKYGQELIKKELELKYIPGQEQLLKYDLPLSIITDDPDFILPVSRLGKQTFMDYVHEWAYLKYKETDLIHQGDFASVIPKNTFLNDTEGFYMKEYHQAFLDYRNEWVIKEKLHSKLAQSTQEWVTKPPKHSFLDYSEEWVSKPPKHSFIDYDEEWVSKIPKEAWFHKDEWASGKPKEAMIQLNDVWVHKVPKLGYYAYQEFVFRKSHELDVYKQEWATKEINMSLYDFSFAFKDVPDLYIQKGLFIQNDTIRNMDIYKAMCDIHRTMYEAQVNVNDFGNWAWVWEPPDPFLGDPFGIDELLLPEKDVRYEDFIDLIFDKDKMKPKNPIKKLSPQSWVAKLPTKHPIKDYSDVAVEYTGIVIDQYYGVRTMIMHQIYLKYYEIWQKHLFEFAQMTMQQSVNKMLDYIYAWIMMYYPPEQLKEALRVFRQIRWFSEMAVMNNSQYIVSYEWDELKSDLWTGECAIPNNLYGNDTMYVDAKLSVIRNNEYFVGAEKAYVEFYLNPRKNTEIKFSLINTVGSVNIYIDDKLVDRVSVTTANLVYKIDYTGKQITVRIEKPKEHNLDANFMIANIIVPDGKFKDLDIYYDPDLKQGNKPIDEIAKKMIQWANMRSDAAIAYENIQKTNLGITVTMNRMMEYWELHHQDKIKGKRLTIKKV